MTGVEYVPTGRSPYFLEFRRLIQRLLLSCQRANDLRIYQDGDLTVGVRPGKAFLQNTPIDFAGTSGITISSETTTYLWLSPVGLIEMNTTGFPPDRTSTIPLAVVSASASKIESIVDHRGECYLHQPSIQSIGSPLSVQAIHQGPLNTNTNGLILGASPITGRATQVFLSVASNIQSDTPTDGVRADVSVNENPLTTTSPSITDSDGPGNVSTAKGDGTPAVIKSDGTEDVYKGDIITVDLTRIASGNITSEASNITVVVVITAT